MEQNSTRPIITGRGLLGIGIVLAAAPLYFPYIWRYVGLVDWPGAIGFSKLGFGIVSIGIIYSLYGTADLLGVFKGEEKFARASIIAALAFPILLLSYWLYGQFSQLIHTSSPKFLVISAFAYLPIALGTPRGFATEWRQRNGIDLLACVSISIPAYLILQIALSAGGFVFLIPIGWFGTLIYDALLGYPLYRFAKYGTFGDERTSNSMDENR